MIIGRYDVILDQSERAHLCNHLSNYNILLLLTPVVNQTGVKEGINVLTRHRSRLPSTVLNNIAVNINFIF